MLIMEETRYVIVGENPIRVEVDGKSTSTSICWRVKTFETVNCVTNYHDEMFCQTITLTPLTCDDTEDVKVTGTIETIGGLAISYEITQKHFTCEGEKDCTCKCTPVRTWTIPYFLEEDYEGDIEFYYEYYLTNSYVDEGSTYVCSRELKIGHQTISSSELGTEITIEEDCGDGNSCKVVAECGRKDDGCTSEPGVKLIVGFTLTPGKVPGTGGTVTIRCNFRKITTDEECNETIKNGYFIKSVDVPECSITPDDKSCCYQHTVEIPVTIQDIIESAGVPEGTAIWFNGEEITEEQINMTIQQEAVLSDECNDSCEPKTTYCVDQSSVTVMYENGYDTDIWLTEEEGGIVPYVGGRIKVSWDYTATTRNSMCNEITSTHSYEEIISVGACDEVERPDEYVILFKEITPGCNGCNECGEEGCEYCEEEGGIVYNKIVVVPKQDGCHATCDCDSFTLDIDDGCNCNSFTLDIDDGCNCNSFSLDIDDGCGCNSFSLDASPQN